MIGKRFVQAFNFTNFVNHFVRAYVFFDYLSYSNEILNMSISYNTIQNKDVRCETYYVCESLK